MIPPRTASGARCGRRCVAAVLGLLLGLAVAPAPGLAQGIELTPSTQQSLVNVQEGWIQWLAAFDQGDREAVQSVVDDLLVVVRPLGIEALPDLSAATLVRAVEAAREGDPDRAELALESAERLDPGRPETAFARATVSRLNGDWPQAAASLLGGYLRLLNQPRERRIWTADLAVGALYVLLLAGGLFVAVGMATRGGRLYRDLASVLGRVLPGWTVPTVVAVALAWPVVLPGGPAWLVLYWSLLLWTYGSPSMRSVLIALWLVAGLTPLVVGEARDRVELELLPPVRALDQVVERRLYGGLFTDLAVVPELLPGDPAVSHLLADVHRRLDQWERASTLYRRVLSTEPENAEAYVDLGTYYFYQADYGAAIDYFERAAEADPTAALPHFNLSQAHGLSYHFDEAGQALDRALELGGAKVNRWTEITGEGTVVEAAGGVTRVPAIRERLAAAVLGEEEGEERVELVGQAWSLLVAVGFLVTAFGFHLLRQRHGGAGRVPEPPGRGRWSLLLVPGLGSLRDDRGFLAFAALALPSLLVVLALGPRLGFELPLGHAVGGAAVTAAVAGLAVVYLLRALWILPREG